MFKKTPTVYDLKDLHQACISGNDLAGIRDPNTGITSWVPARPEGYWTLGNRIKAAWLVFSGKADAVKWPGGQ